MVRFEQSNKTNLVVSVTDKLGLNRRTLQNENSEPAQDWQRRANAISSLGNALLTNKFSTQEGLRTAVDKISSGLNENTEADSRVRIESINSLKKIAIQQPGLISPERFMRPLGDSNSHVRATAIKTLTELGESWVTSGILTYLINRLDLEKSNLTYEREGEIQERINTIRLLAAQHATEAVPALRSQLYDEDPQIREAAILALSNFKEIGLPDLFRGLEAKMLYDDDSSVRRTMVVVLQGNYPLNTIITHLKSREASLKFRKGAARILGELPLEDKKLISRELTGIAADIEIPEPIRIAAINSLSNQQILIPRKTREQLLRDTKPHVVYAAMSLITE